MNQQQLAAYEALCAKVSEARCATIEHTDYDGGAWWIDSCRIENRTALAILTAHLEAMLPPRTVLYWPRKLSCGCGTECFEYALPEPYDYGSDHDRFIALCRAVEASR